MTELYCKIFLYLKEHGGVATFEDIKGNLSLEPSQCCLGICIIQLFQVGKLYNGILQFTELGKKLAGFKIRRYISPSLRTDVLSAGKCRKCGSRDKLSVDYIFPFSLGGLTVRENLQCLCRSCNSKKGNRQKELRSQMGVIA